MRAVVSLSGGVDSMVLAFILSRLGAGRWRVAGAHIDYGNRPESGAEAEFVAAWCAEQGIEFRVKRIEELRRGIAGRDEYERESRRVRYDFYAACLAEFAGCGGVCVGHHAGDVQENVITNLLKGTSLLGISGMTEVSTVNGVPVWCARDVQNACLPAATDLSPVQAAAAAVGEGRGVHVRAPLRRPILPVRHGLMICSRVRLCASLARLAAATRRRRGARAASCGARCCRSCTRCSAKARFDS